MRKISVITPMYNEEKFIADCIASVLQYSGKNCLEMVVIDDNSSDQSEAIASRFEHLHEDCVRVLSNPEKGKVRAINFGFTQSSGDFFVFLGGDDLINSSALDARIAPIARAPGPAISRAALLTFSSQAEHDNVRYPKRGGGNKSGGAVCFNRAFAEVYFPVPPSLPNEDTWLDAITLLTEPDLHVVDMVALYYRIHGGNSWSRDSDFETYSRQMATRYAAYSLALGLNHAAVTDSGRQKVSEIVECERLRLEGRWLHILLRRTPSLSVRVHFVIGARKWLYSLRRRTRHLNFQAVRSYLLSFSKKD